MIYLKIILDERKKKELSPVKLRLTHNRRQEYYSTGINMTKTDFQEATKATPSKKWKEMREIINHIELKARNIISKLDVFSIEGFENNFLASTRQARSIFDLYEKVIKEKMSLGSISTAIGYRCSLNSLKKFAPKLTFIDITPDFLKKYERFLLNQNKSVSTVGIYIRPLRAIFNQAITEKIISADLYPFGRKKYIVPESTNTKKVLTHEDFIRIYEYQPNEKLSFEDRAKDFWILSYLCQGMNPKDILLLKKNNLDRDYIRFVREKTKDTIRNVKQIVVPLLPETKLIIQKWKDSDNESPYLFGFVKLSMTPLEIYKLVQQFVKMTNKYMEIIAKKLGIDKKITCYTARYQFTKTLIDADQPIEYLRQCLGHNNSVTTQRYISSFEDNRRMEIATKYLLNKNFVSNN